MLLVGSALKGYAIQANDGNIGTVSDFLFDNSTWKVRWLVIDTGKWLSGRKVLIHPSAIGRAHYLRRELPVTLTKQQVTDSPDIHQDEPVSRQMEHRLYDYYGWNPAWSGGYYGMGAIASPLSTPLFFGSPGMQGRAVLDASLDDADPHLRSMAVVTGHHVEASDAEIGHVSNFIVDEASWGVHDVMIDTRNGWFGKHVLIAPSAITAVRCSDSHIQLSVTRDQVKTTPEWNPAEAIDRAYEHRRHAHYAWPAYGW